MTANYLPKISNRQKRSGAKHAKSISFVLGRSTGKHEQRTTLSGLNRHDNSENHDNEVKKILPLTMFHQGDPTYGHGDGKRTTEKNIGSLSEVFSISISENNDLQPTENFEENCESKECELMKLDSSNEALKLRKVLRAKDQEISRLQDVIRKMSLDRERAECSNVNSRMRINELKNKLSGEHRKVEHVTTVERLRSKQKVSSETERLRLERDEARAQLAQHETLVWQLRKQVEQLGYVSQQRYKTIQELGKKMANKDKTLQDLRKRMEQAQLIQICTGAAAAERRASVTDTRHVAWETPSRLATVNEK